MIAQHEAYSRGLLIEGRLFACACLTAILLPVIDGAFDRARLGNDGFGQLPLHAEGFPFGRVDLVFLLSVLYDDQAPLVSILIGAQDSWWRFCAHGQLSVSPPGDRF